MTQAQERIAQLRQSKTRLGDLPSVLKSFEVRNLCEVGVSRGDNFRRLLRCQPTQAVAVDLWRNDDVLSHNDLQWPQSTLNDYYQGIVNLGKTNPGVMILRELSTTAARHFDVAHFDFVFIDADHTYEGCKADIQAWYPTVKSGGILAGHDYKNKIHRTSEGRVCFGVVQAVDEFVKANELADYFYVSPERCPSWFIVRPSQP